MQTNYLSSDLRFYPIPLPGEVKFYIDLGELKHLTIDQAIAIAREHGYEPTLKYWQNKNGTFFFAVLGYEKHSTAESFDAATEAWSDKWQSFSLSLGEDRDAVRCPRAQPKELQKVA